MASDLSQQSLFITVQTCNYWHNSWPLYKIVLLVKMQELKADIFKPKSLDAFFNSILLDCF